MVSISCSSLSNSQPRFSNYAMTARQLKTTWIKWLWHQSEDSCSLTNTNPITLGSTLFIYLRSISFFFSNNRFTAVLSFVCFIISLVIYTCFEKSYFFWQYFKQKVRTSAFLTRISMIFSDYSLDWRERTIASREILVFSTQAQGKLGIRPGSLSSWVRLALLICISVQCVSETGQKPKKEEAW